MAMKALFLPIFLLIFFEDNLFGKVLKCPQIVFLNIALESRPFVIARLKLSNKGIVQVDKNLAAEVHKENEFLNATNDEDEKKFIHAQLKLILEPVNEFFNSIRVYTSLIKPLFEESICSPAGSKNQSSYLIKFLESSSDFFTFFTKSIETRKELRLACVEFKTFLTDIEESLDALVKQNYEKFIKDLKAKKLQDKHDIEDPSRSNSSNFFSGKPVEDLQMTTTLSA